MATLDELGFEMERRVIVFHRDTTMPGGSQLGYIGDPNAAVNGATPGQTLLYNSPSGTRYLDKGTNPHEAWSKTQDGAGGIWVKDGTGTGGGGDIFESETFILTSTDIANGYVQLVYQPVTADEVIFSIKNAPAQHYGDDFKQDPIFLKRISWEGMELEGLLQVGDKITITYTRGS